MSSWKLWGANLEIVLVNAVLGGLLFLVIAAAWDAWITGRASGVCTVDCTGTIENIADELFGAWLLPFEATVLLLTIAAVGTVALAQFALKPRLVEPGGDEE